MKLLSLFISILLLSGCSSLYKKNHIYQVMNEYNFSSDLGEYFEPIWPVDQARLTQHFAPSSNRSHDGIDLSNKQGTPIKAVQDGVVIYAGRRFKGYGKMLIVQHNNRWSTLYAHFHRLKVKTGQKIHMGQIIGLMGNTGRSTGVHLHFEVLKNKIPVNPIEYLPQITSLVKNK